MVGAARFSTIVLVCLGALVLGAPIESVHAQNAGGDIIWAFIVNDFNSDPVARTF